MADRLTPRRVGFTRTISLQVPVAEPAALQEGLLTLVDLLFVLSGDNWDIELVEEPEVSHPDPAIVPDAERVSLFSGGLDSYCGAVLSLRQDQPYGYLSHRDNPITAGAQNAASSAIAQLAPDFRTIPVEIAQGEPPTERSSRSRSFLFMALGVAVASARGASVLEVPENGFTSLNPPLRIDRTGPLSTRSTHPYTLALMNQLLAEIGVSVTVEDPFLWLTKGELVRRMVEREPGALSGIASTLSCAKMDGRFIPGGNSHLNCGLCFACVVRRASVLAAGVDDPTTYLVEQLEGAQRSTLESRRAPDIQAIKWLLAAPLDEDTLVNSCSFPHGFDLTSAVDLCRRSVEELRLVRLP